MLYGLPLAVVGVVGGVPVTWLAMVVGSALVGIFSANLLSRLLPDHVAGRACGAEGGAATEFFVVRAGELVVSRQGAEVRTLGAGDAFGEVALLRTVPRTATVTARSATDLLCIGHELFVSAVTGHRSTGARAAAVVSGLLDEDFRRGQPDPLH